MPVGMIPTAPQLSLLVPLFTGQTLNDALTIGIQGKQRCVPALSIEQAAKYLHDFGALRVEFGMKSVVYSVFIKFPVFSNSVVVKAVHADQELLLVGFQFCHPQSF